MAEPRMVAGQSWELVQVLSQENCWWNKKLVKDTSATSVCVSHFGGSSRAGVRVCMCGDEMAWSQECRGQQADNRMHVLCFWILWKYSLLFGNFLYINVIFVLLSKSLILQKQSTNTHALGNKMCRVVNLKILRIGDMLPSIKNSCLKTKYDRKEDPFATTGFSQLHNICKSYWNLLWPEYIFLVSIFKMTGTYKEKTLSFLCAAW